MDKEIVSVAFQGEPGAYSEQALRKYYDRRGVEAGGTSFDSLEEVIRSVEKGRVKRGIIPVENSVGGYVDSAYKLISQGGVYVRGEVYLRVRHSLLGVPGTDLGEVKRVYSHPQALKQCRDFLTELGVDTRATYDTAGSAKMVREKGEPAIAAIASRFAGEKYGLDILREDVQTRENNRTRFLIVSSEPRRERIKDVDYKTTITFELGDSPGSLYDCLAPFAEKGINLTLIQSRPTDSGSWEYHFDLELEGYSEEEPARSALEELKNVVPRVEVLGSYPSGNRI
ncbi:MAG: prephenate dehydratase [Candidatus Bipolaricaulota bacterium]